MKAVRISSYLVSACLSVTTNIHAANAALFNISMNAGSIVVTAVPNHVYPDAGIKIVTSGYSLANPGTDCRMNNNGYCLFTVSQTEAASLALTGPAGTVEFDLCLNGKGPISCQRYNTTLTASAPRFVYAGNYINSNLSFCNVNAAKWNII